VTKQTTTMKRTYCYNVHLETMLLLRLLLL